MTATQDSLYEHLFPLTTVMKQRVVDNFDGDSLNERWQTNVFSGGTPTFAMVDAVDEGFEIDSASSVSPRGGFINFNVIRQYDFDNAIHISEWRVLSIASVITACGFGGDAPTLSDHRCEARFDSVVGANYLLLTSDGTTNTTSDSGVVADTNFHTFKTRLTSTLAELFIDGALETSKTDRLPAAKMEPIFIVLQRSAAAKQGHIRYYEAFNV